MLLKILRSLSIWTAFDNIALPLKLAGKRARDYAEDVRDLVEFVGLAGAAHLPQSVFRARNDAGPP